MSSQNLLSSYLVTPSNRYRRRRRWLIFRAQLSDLGGRHQRLLGRTFGALILWAGIASALGYSTTPHSLTDQSIFNSDSAAVDAGSSFTGNAALASASHVKTLPGGPSGQLLPPGTMAADRTFPNGYARGQCTWYVAGRRQVPGNWGNAATWYYHAVANGWSVGTVPAVAAIAWTPAGRFGHVALVEQVSADGRSVYISEMNYRAVYVKTYRWVPATSFKYIY